MRDEALVKMMLVHGVRVYVNKRSSLRKVTKRIVIQPGDSPPQGYNFMLENMAFIRGEAIRPDVFAVHAVDLCRSPSCELVIAPDAIGDPVKTLALHRAFIESSPSWLVKLSAAVIQERRPSKIMDYARRVMDMGFERIAIPSDNSVATRLAKSLRSMFGYVHILGCQSGCIHDLFSSGSYLHIDSIDVVGVQQGV